MFLSFIEKEERKVRKKREGKKGEREKEEEKGEVVDQVSFFPSLAVLESYFSLSFKFSTLVVDTFDTFPSKT